MGARMDDRGRRELDLGRAMAVHAHAPLEVHGARGDRSGLVEAQDVHARKHLDAVELLDEDALSRKSRRGDGKHRRGEKHETLRDHAHERGNRREDGLVDRGAVLQRAQEQQDAHGGQQPRGPADDHVERAHDLGLGALDVLGLGIDARGIAVRANARHARDDAA